MEPRSGMIVSVNAFRKNPKIKAKHAQTPPECGVGVCCSVWFMAI
ncbi:MAG TPA: hypothetical protein VN455_02640 [Methanotrichaceae archaeon]|nr:hypothetical protein [Methanotrichaceae archaeon]